MTGSNPAPNDLDAILREPGSLEGLAEQLGQRDPNAKAFGTSGQ